MKNPDPGNMYFFYGHWKVVHSLLKEFFEKMPEALIHRLMIYWIKQLKQTVE